MHVTLLDAAAREEDAELQASEVGTCRAKGPSRWSDDAWDYIRRVVFVTIYFIAIMLSSTLVCSWITDAIGALRQEHIGRQFSVEAAMTSFQTYGVVYTMCVDMAVRETLMQTARDWKAEQDTFKAALQFSQRAMDTLVVHTTACKDQLRQVHATFQASNGPLQCTTQSDLFELETLNNAWSIRQPSSESWLIVERSNLNGTTDDQMSTSIEDHKASIVHRLNATNLAIQRAVGLGAVEATRRFDRMQQIATSLQDSLTFPSAVTGQPMEMGQALKSTQDSMRGIKAMWVALEPALELSGAKKVSPMNVLNEVDANLDQMIQLEQTWNGKLQDLQGAINETHVDAQQLQEAVMVYTTDISADLELLSKDELNQSKGDLAAYSNWTIRTALLQQQRRPASPFFPPLGLANWTNSSSNDPDAIPKTFGLDIQLEGAFIPMSYEYAGRFVFAILLAVKVWNKSYTEIPHLDNQGISTIRTMADWGGVFRCRHSLFSVLYSLSTIKFVPYFWAIFIITIFFGATFGLVVPVNRMHTVACSNHTDKSSASLGGFVVSMAAKHFQAEGDFKAMEGYAQLDSIHHRTCMAYQQQLDALNGVAFANASAWMDDYSHLHAVLKLFQQCNISATNASNSSSIASCSMQPEILRRVSVATNWTCPSRNWTLASIKKPCTTTLTQEFKDSEGKMHGCGLERLVLESVVMWWVWLILVGTLNLLRLVLMKVVAITLWRALSGGRMPFVGFVGDDGTVLDQSQLTHRFERQLDDYMWLRRVHGTCAGLVLCLGVTLIVATLSTLP